MAVSAVMARLRALGTRLASLWQRWFLWLLLALLVSALLATVVWLAGRHEAEQVQAALDRDTADALADLRTGLRRNTQHLQALPVDAALWQIEVMALLRSRHELLRIERLDATLQPLASADTPYQSHILDATAGTTHPAGLASGVADACSDALRLGSARYAPSHFVPMGDSPGLEVMTLCLPLMLPRWPQGQSASAQGYLVARYSLRDLLNTMVGTVLTRGQEVALTEPDGTRLVAVGNARRIGNRIFTSQQPLELPGVTLVLRVDGWRAEPDLFPNMLTALVTAMSIALVSVLVLLARDTRRRLRAERELADTLAFRQAMEDSLITGLRARDLQGRITYVNPAFCEMVGFTAEELGSGAAHPPELPAGPGSALPPDLSELPELPDPPQVPYWPTGLAHEYQQRQRVRLSGDVPSREGFESVFMRKDGSRFPVLIFEAPLLNAQRVQTGWMSACVDLSEQRRIEELSRVGQERLQASARLATVGEMASLLSHELTQPLAAIASYASGSLNLLAQAKADAADAAGAANDANALAAAGTARVAPAEIADLADLAELTVAMQRIAEQAERAGQIIRSVHDFVRRREPTREAVAPQALLDAVLPLVRLQARKLDVQVRVTLVAPPTLPTLPAVYCDRTLVEQVLLNLARNAMQAMDQPGFSERLLHLRVALADRDGDSDGTPTAHRRLDFSVSDGGDGISDEVAAKLFTPFFTTRSDGMGLGLSLCRTVVEQHGGVLRHQPNLPRGTVFSFTLPVASALATPLESV